MTMYFADSSHGKNPRLLHLRLADLGLYKAIIQHPVCYHAL